MSTVDLVKLREQHLVTGYADYDSSKSIFRTARNLNNVNNTYKFREELVKIFDDAVIENNLYICSPEQEKFLLRYFSEANGELSEEMIQLDKFLGEYKEEEIING